MATATSAPPSPPMGPDLPVDGMRLPGRILLVLTAHLAVLAAVWWSWHPRAGDSNPVPGLYPKTLGSLAMAAFILVLLQVTARVPFRAFCTLFVLVPFAVFFLQFAGYRVWTTAVMDGRQDVTVTRTQHLRDGGYRLWVTGADGPGETLAYSTLGRRTTTNYEFAPIHPGQHLDLLTDPTGLSVPLARPTGHVGSAADHTSPVWATVTGTCAVFLELLCVSALTRRRSQIMAVDGTSPRDAAQGEPSP